MLRIGIFGDFDVTHGDGVRAAGMTAWQWDGGKKEERKRVPGRPFSFKLLLFSNNILTESTLDIIIDMT